jgi:outer membrane protein OmpA-like peptidoglycan-associated protein
MHLSPCTTNLILYKIINCQQYLENSNIWKTMLYFANSGKVYFMKAHLLLLALISVSACNNPQSGPDKSIGGSILGAGIGAGVGAVIGNQVSFAGEGAAIGAGFGAVTGLVSGIAFDLTEGAILDQERALASLKLQNDANASELKNLQARLDKAVVSNIATGVHQVFFDLDVTSLKAGAIANLEVIAEQIKTNPHAPNIHVVGHSDDSGNPEYNARLAEARARTVSAYLASRGIASDHIQVSSFGSERPIASNSSDVGRQLNRRVDVYISR